MILPTKHLRQDRALIGVGAEVLALLGTPMTVSALWERFRATRAAKLDAQPITFDWFVLALCFLNTISAIEAIEGNLIAKAGGTR